MIRTRRSMLGMLALVVGCAVVPLAPSAAAGATPAWSSARAAACAVQLDAHVANLVRLDVASGARQQRAVPAAQAAATAAARCLETTVVTAPPAVRRAATPTFVSARGALAARGARRAASRGALTAGLRVLAAEATSAAVAAGDVRAARAWLVLRERRASTRIGVPDAPAAAAIAALDRGELAPAAAVREVRADLTATTLVVLRGRLAAIEDRLDADLLDGAAVSAAQAAASWLLVARDGAAAPLAAAAIATPVDPAVLRAAATRLDRAAAGHPAASLGAEDAAETAGRVARFLELVPVEYERGVRDGHVSLALEIQEARAFLRGAMDAWTAVQPTVAARDDAAATRMTAALEELDALVTRAETTPADVADAGDVATATDSALSALRAGVPDSWLERTAAGDLELVHAALGRVRTAVASGDRRTAEQARVEAYGSFEFGPELRLRAIDPSLALDVEELIWFGDSDLPGLATLIANGASSAELEPTLEALGERLVEVEAKLSTSATPGAIRTNSAIIVLREGMEAVLILAALTAGLSGAGGGRWRRPILIGGALALVATAVTFVLARALLDSLARFGEQLEVVVSLVAIAVLLLILNWFVHKAYWTGWMANFQKKKVAIAGTARERREAPAEIDHGARRASAIAQAGGLIVLGFTSIYREGFETVLFLQALVLDAGTLPVLEGAAIGMVCVTALAVLTMYLQRRLPYRKMLIVTGVLIATVLAAMVGGTTQSMQAIGWLPVHPIVGLDVPGWMATWLGVHPTWEAVSGQFASIVFVLGSYVVAEWWQEHKRARRRAERSSVDASVAPVPQTPRGAGSQVRDADPSRESLV
ncbi:MAG: iron permease [Thermoleophilia bacterium]|nr:iron permease [Thermoleophilia bacterium]